jgi:phosphate transport system substrate-binding protein
MVRVEDAPNELSLLFSQFVRLHTAPQEQPRRQAIDLGVSFHAEIAEAGLGTALLKSYSGEFLLPSPETVAAAAASLSPRTPADERLTLVNAPGANAYPLVNYEYAIVSTRQANPATAEAVRKFLLWAIAPDEANEKYLEEAHFIALPAHIWVLSHDQIETIK